MPLISVRQKFVEFSGRYDLVKDEESWADNGANFFIRAGQKWLDRFSDIYQSQARHFASLAIDQWFSLIPNIRTVEDVWVSDSEGNKWKLEKLTFEDFKAEFPINPSLTDSGLVVFYTSASLRVSPETVGTITIDKFGPISYSDVTKNHWNYTGLLFLPPTDEVLTLEVWGKFYQPTLTLDSDRNFWSEENEFILVLASCRALEISYRNTAGVKDWQMAIESEMQGLEFDFVDQISTGYTQMEG